MNETPKPPVQRQAVRSLAEEPFHEHFRELSEIEQLGLDESRFPITMRDQSELWPKAVAWLYGFGYAGEKKLAEVVEERFNDAFEHFKLNVGTYDKDENPDGMLVGKLRNPESAKKTLVLRMLGINQGKDLWGFFGAQAPVVESPVFGSVHEAQETKRDRFLIDHRSEYPRIDKLFGELESAYGLRPDTLFKSGRTPRLKLHKGEVHTMEHYLLYLTRALSGSATRTELSQSGPTRGMEWSSIKPRLQPDVAALVEGRMKRDRKRRS